MPNASHMSSEAVPSVLGPTVPEPNVPGRPVARRPKAIAKRETPIVTKSDLVLKKLRSARGVSLQQLADMTGWQLHSVRGFLSAVVRKKLELNLVSDVGKDEVRRYRILNGTDGASS